MPTNTTSGPGQKTALVIGGTRRVGRWVSEALLVGECRVAAVYRERNDDAERFKAEMTAAGHQLEVFQADVTDPHQASDVVQSAAETGGGLDILVICTGSATQGSITATSSGELERVWQSNVLAVHNTVITAKPFLRARQGRIIAFLTIGSDTLKAFKEIPAYGACKSMLASYCRSLARELAPQQITVNCIALGITELPAEEVPSYAEKTLPTGKAVTQEDVAAAIWFLTGPASGQITGSVINLSGGFGL